MGAPAVSPRPRTRPAPRSPRRAPAPARRTARSPRPAAARANHRSRVAAGGSVAMFPVNAVGGIADSGFVVGMSRGRAWIVVLGVLLGGIVALNVVGLSLSSSGGAVSAKAEEIQQENSVLRGRIASRLSNERITRAATALGLSVPAPDAVHYLDAKRSDAEKAAQRLADGLIANAPPAVEGADAAIAATDPAATASSTTDPAAVPVAPAATATTDPAAVAVDPTATTDPALTAPSTTP